MQSEPQFSNAQKWYHSYTAAKSVISGLLMTNSDVNFHLEISGLDGYLLTLTLDWMDFCTENTVLYTVLCKYRMQCKFKFVSWHCVSPVSMQIKHWRTKLVCMPPGSDLFHLVRRF